MTRKHVPESAAPSRIDAFPALIADDTSVTFARYHRLVAGAIEWLKENGITRGQRIGILADNSIEYIITLLAVMHSGAVACALSTRYPNQSLVDMLAAIECRKVLCSDQKMLVDPTITTLPLPEMSQLNLTATPPPQPDLERDATILFTSGTGAVPKAVLHAHGSHYYSALGSNDNIALQPGDRWLLSLPLYHVGGLGIVFRCLLAGAAVVVAGPSKGISDAIARHRITHLSVVPTQLSELISRPPSAEHVQRIKCVLTGGGPVGPRLLEDALGCGFRVCTTYGSTEMASQVTTTAPDDPPQKLHTSGILLNHRDLKICREGEVLVRGRTLFRGYVTSSGLHRPFDNDGWFHTGDIGSLDSDGYLVIAGRKDNMFISGGENIHPEEIESVMRSVDGVEDVVVVPVKDPKFGQRPAAFVKTTIGEKLEEDKLVAFLVEKLPKYKIPVKFLPWPEDERGGLKPNRKQFASLAKELAN